MTQTYNQWTNYWKSGNLTSLPGDFERNYDGDIANFWNNIFKTTRKEGNILDLCTGNGAIAILAESFSNKHRTGFNVTGIDAADIDKKTILAKNPELQNIIENIDFQPNCKVENINIAGGSFDLISSQYGIEYCKWDTAAKNIVRLLNENGRLVFISHSHSTDILEYMKQEKIEYSILNEINMFNYLDDYFSKRKPFLEFKNELKGCYVQLIKMNRTSQSPLLRGVVEFLNHVVELDFEGLKRESSKILTYYTQHFYAYKRLEDIISVSERIANSEDWTQCFQNEGLYLKEQGIIMQKSEHNAGSFYIFEK